MLFLSRVVEKSQNLKPYPQKHERALKKTGLYRMSVCAAVGSTCVLLGSSPELERLEAKGWGACCNMGYLHSPQRTRRASAKHFKLSAEEHGAGSKGQNSCHPNGSCQWGIGPNHKEGRLDLLTDPPTPVTGKLSSKPWKSTHSMSPGCHSASPQVLWVHKKEACR